MPLEPLPPTPPPQKKTLQGGSVTGASTSKAMGGGSSWPSYGKGEIIGGGGLRGRVQPPHPKKKTPHGRGLCPTPPPPPPLFTHQAQQLREALSDGAANMGGGAVRKAWTTPPTPDPPPPHPQIPVPPPAPSSLPYSNHCHSPIRHMGMRGGGGVPSSFLSLPPPHVLQLLFFGGRKGVTHPPLQNP